MTASPDDAAPLGSPSRPQGGDGEPSDEALLARIAAGGGAARDDAFATLYGRWSTTVMSFAYHLTYDRGLAEDVTQEAFVRVWRFAGGFREGGRFAPWVLQIARRLVYDRTAGWRRGRAAGGAPDLAPATGPSEAAVTAEASARRTEVADAIRAALDALSEPLREAFVLVRLCGASYAGAAEVLECPVGTVKSRMATAEAALRGRLARFL